MNFKLTIIFSMYFRLIFGFILIMLSSAVLATSHITPKVKITMIPNKALLAKITAIQSVTPGVKTIDDKMLEINALLPNFGGMFYDKVGNLNVYRGFYLAR